jgi:hypothetical protein
MGSGGYYWSSIGAGSGTTAYNLAFSKNYVYASTNPYYRAYGFSVRCVAE